MTGQNEIGLPDPAADPQSYWRSLLAVVGDGDPLAIIAQTTERIRSLIDGRSNAELERRPTEGEWSAAEIIGHLLDDEIVNGFRLRMTLTADRPSYPGTDPDRWAALPKPPFAEVWQAFQSLRAYNLWLMKSIPRNEWQRIGIHAEQGPENVELLFLKNAGHDLAHLDQLERAIAP